MSKSAVGRSWEDLEKEIYTEKEIAASDLRVAQINEMIKTGEQQKDSFMVNEASQMTDAQLHAKLQRGYGSRMMICGLPYDDIRGDTMNEINGICYGDDKLIKISEAELLQDNRRYLVTFNTGERRIFDPLTLKGSAYLPLRDGNALKNFSLFHGVLTWCDGTIDVAPETVYAESIGLQQLCAYLAQVADDVRVGRVQNADEVFDGILGELNKADHER